MTGIPVLIRFRCCCFGLLVGSPSACVCVSVLAMIHSNESYGFFFSSHIFPYCSATWHHEQKYVAATVRLALHVFLYLSLLFVGNKKKQRCYSFGLCRTEKNLAIGSLDTIFFFFTFFSLTLSKFSVAAHPPTLTFFNGNPRTTETTVNT